MNTWFFRVLNGVSSDGSQVISAKRNPKGLKDSANIVLFAFRSGAASAKARDFSKNCWEADRSGNGNEATFHIIWVKGIEETGGGQKAAHRCKEKLEG